ncbi:MAG: translation initiation factor IF-3 [Clostridia bacterium]|nr:translation initiation factor IF-3 [Clostridia bacterium]
MNHQINEEIRDKEVRLIAENGEQIGIVPASEALRMAEEKDRDLVKISPNAKPPVCKIMDYGKYRYELLKKEKEAKKNQKTNEVKELSLSSITIDVHDLETKAKQCIKFFGDYDKVRLSIRMRGRQQARPQMAVDVMMKFYELVKDHANIEVAPKQEGRNVFMILAKIKEKK